MGAAKAVDTPAFAFQHQTWVTVALLCAMERLMWGAAKSEGQAGILAGRGREETLVIG